MGVRNSPDIFQEKIRKMIHIFQFIWSYIDNFLIFTQGGWYNHIEKLERIIDKLKENRHKYNIENPFFGQTKMENQYYGWLGKQSVPQTKGIIHSKHDATRVKHQVCEFIGLVKYYRYMWSRRSHLLQPLTKLMSDKVKFK